MFVGGCTMAEVAALRFLSQQVKDFNCLVLLFGLGDNDVCRKRTMWSTWWLPPQSSLESPS